MRRGLEVLLALLTSEPAFANLAIVEMLAAGPRGRERVRKLLQNFQRFYDDAPRQPGQPRVPPVAVEAVVAGPPTCPTSCPRSRASCSCRSSVRVPLPR